MNENHRKFLVKDFRFIIGLIALCSTIGFLEFLVPLLDLFNHFRLQAIVGAAVCGICSLCLNDKKTAAFAVMVLLVNLTTVGGKLYQTSGIPAIHDNKTPSLSIISSNVLTSNTDYEAVIHMIEKENPDLVVFSEVNEVWLKNLEALEKSYKYTLKHPRPDNFGLAAYAKKPFKGDVKFSGNAHLPMFVLKFDELTVIGAHPLPPASTGNMAENRAYLSDIASMGREVNTPVVVAGDLNATLWSAALNPLIDSGFDRINPFGIAYTWPRKNIFLAIQIDHFFAKNISAADFEVLPSVGSDHYSDQDGDFVLIKKLRVFVPSCL